MKTYNHMLDVAFTVTGPWENWMDVPKSNLLAALQKRVDYLKSNPQECIEAIGYSDSYEETT